MRGYTKDMTRNERTGTTSMGSVVKENRESKIQDKVQELRNVIQRARNEGFSRIADLWTEELQTVIGNCQLEGLNVS